MTKIVGTLGPKSRSVEVISGCLKAGMSGNTQPFIIVIIQFYSFLVKMDLMGLGLLGAVARFDFSWGNPKYHQETLENLKAAVKTTKKLCAVRFLFIFLYKIIYYAYCNSNVETFCVVQVMLDTVGPELQVVNKSGNPISLLADGSVILTPDQEQEASSEVLPINFDGLSKVCYTFVFTLFIFGQDTAGAMIVLFLQLMELLLGQDTNANGRFRKPDATQSFMMVS